MNLLCKRPFPQEAEQAPAKRAKGDQLIAARLQKAVKDRLTTAVHTVKTSIASERRVLIDFAPQTREFLQSLVNQFMDCE
jgi:hypothetical protein